MAVKVFQVVSRFCNVHRWSFVFFVLLFGTLTSFAQTPEPTPPVKDDEDKPINVKTDLVTLTLTVTDLYGRFVSGLKKNAFTVFDNPET